MKPGSRPANSVVPAAPPVHRPAKTAVAAPAVYRPNVAAPLQPKQGLAAPLVYRPLPAAGHQHPSAVCQRKHFDERLNGWYTDSEKYFIDNANPHKLYSADNADPPQPTSLYTKSWAFLKGEKWASWTPSVKFLSREDKEEGEYLQEYVKEYEKAQESHGQGKFIFGKNDCAVFASVLRT